MPRASFSLLYFSSFWVISRDRSTPLTDQVAPLDSRFMSDVLTCARRKRIARMIIEAGREKWASKKREQPGLLAPQSASPMEVVSAGWELIGGVSDFDESMILDAEMVDGFSGPLKTHNAYATELTYQSHYWQKACEILRSLGSRRVTLSVHDLNAGIYGVNWIENATIVIVYLLP